MRPLVDVGVGALERDAAVAPGAVREHDAGEAPVFDEFAEVDVAPDLRVRGTKCTPGRPRWLPDRGVLLVAERVMPARKAVLDLPVGARVLLEDDDLDALLGERRGDLRAGDGAADDGHAVGRLSVRHAAHDNGMIRGLPARGRRSVECALQAASPCGARHPPRARRDPRDRLLLDSRRRALSSVG